MVSSPGSGGRTGPKTERGKATASRNSLKHGLLSSDLIIGGESREEFDAVLTTLQGELRPVGLLENALVERIAVTLWRQRRMVRAESAGIELRASEKFGPAVLEFRNYLGDAARIADAQKALERKQDVPWLRRLKDDLSAFHPNRHTVLSQFAAACPVAYELLESEAVQHGQPIEDYLQTRYRDLVTFVISWTTHIDQTLAFAELVLLFRDSRRLPNNPDILIRYQSGLDNELYKAMRALREAQTYRLSAIDVVPVRDEKTGKGMR